MKFTCLDFETANASRSSVCSIGITVYENNCVVEEKYWLVRPEPLYFEGRNIMVHGIREMDVINEKPFNEIWCEVKTYLENQIVVAHNASFDFSVLRAVLDLYGIEYPKLKYCCTLVASKIFYGYLPNYKLNTLNRYLGYDFKHHHASEDATAAGNIFVEISKELGLDDINDIADVIGFCLGEMDKNSYTPCRKKYIGMISKKQSTFSGIEGVKYDENVEFFKDKVVVFTGPLGIMERDEASDIIRSLGGIVWNGVTKKTDIVITNTDNPEALDPCKLSSKLRTAVRYKGMGQNIEFLNAEEFQNIIMGYPYEKEVVEG